MSFLNDIQDALILVFTGDPDLWEIIFFSLKISLIALILSSLFAISFALYLTLQPIRYQKGLMLILNGLMGMPPVFIGLLLYMLFSHSGPLGFFDLLYRPNIMILAQALLIFPIMAGLAMDLFYHHYPRYHPLFDNLSLPSLARALCLLHETRSNLFILWVAGLGRALSEVGAVIIVGGNINHYTRMMTTSIVLKTSQGDIGFAFGLGLVLVGIGISLNIILMLVREKIS